MNNIEVRWRGPYSLISSAKNEVIYGVREAETSGISSGQYGWKRNI